MIRIIVLALACALAFAAPALAGEIKVDNAWAHATQDHEGAGHIFLQITNSSPIADRLYAVKTSVSKSIQLGKMSEHATIHDKHNELASILVPPAQSTIFDADGPHIGLMELAEPLTPGQTFDVTLFFENAGRVKISVLVTDAEDHGGMPGHESTDEHNEGMSSKHDGMIQGDDG